MDVAATWEPTDSLTPHPKNPRHNDGAVDEVAASIRTFGFGSPIIARTADRVIIAGHTRWKAAAKLGMDKVPVRFMDLDPARAAALMLADNKLGELAEWDDALLSELAAEHDLDLTTLGWSDEEAAGLLGGGEGEEEEGPYTRKIEAPIYKPTSPTPPPLSALMHTEKRDALIAEIQAARVPAEVEAFLVAAAHRHTVFEYGQIAEYYAHAAPELQELMEHSAVVIVDFDDAVAGGFVRMTKQLAELAGVEGERG